MRNPALDELPFLLDLDPNTVKSLLTSWEEPAFRFHQIWQGIYQQYWEKPADFTQLPKTLREQLEKSLLFSRLRPVRTLSSSDGNTEKILFELYNLPGIETVLMHYEERNTVCVSTQVGCAMGCTFCATGQMGFFKNLTSGEIIEQVLYISRLLQKEGQKLTNIVFMGMGEPFQNYAQVMSAIDRLNDSQGFNFGERRMTISTVGIIPMIDRFAQEKRQVNLAISLHAANDKTRSELLPINKQYPIKPLLKSCWNYVEHTGRRISFEWALIDRINDGVEDARQLVKLLKGQLAHVNIIPLNPSRGYPAGGSEKKRMIRFCQELKAENISYTVRLGRGMDIQAGCGQLATGHKNS
jgi:23S rRNA (adenine2503-C2)-methyltransferase